MNDAVNKSLSDAIKDRKKTEGKGPKKGARGTPRRAVGQKGTAKNRPGQKDRERNAQKTVKPQKVTKKLFSKATASRRFIRPTGPAKNIQKTEKPKEAPSKRRLRISNLDFNITHKDLMDLFSKLGSLTKNRIHYDDLGRSKGTAVIEYEKEESAAKAIEEYDGATLDGKTLSVSFDTVVKKVPSVKKKVIAKRNIPAPQRRDDDRRRDNRRDNRRDDRRDDRDRGGRNGNGNRRRQGGGGQRNQNRNRNDKPRNDRPQNKKRLGGGGKKSE